MSKHQKSKTIAGFKFENQTDSDPSDFIDAFIEVWELLPQSIQAPIRRSLEGITLVEDIARGETYQAASGGITEAHTLVAGQSSRLVFRSDSQDIKNIIAHELRHCWQAAVGWAAGGRELVEGFIRRAGEVQLLERDAELFAHSISPVPVTPADKQLGQLNDFWHGCSDEDQRKIFDYANSLAAGDPAIVLTAGDPCRLQRLEVVWSSLTENEKAEVFDGAEKQLARFAND